MSVRMNDNVISAAGGSVMSFIAMICGFIQIHTLIEIALYGLVGGATGMIGKLIVVGIKKSFEKRFKRNLKNNAG